MRRIGRSMVVAFIVTGLAAVFTSRTSAKVNCPVAPPPGSVVNGGMIVTGVCILNQVTVRGGITVTATGSLELENSFVSGGIDVAPGGELDLGHTLSSNTPTNNPSSITGGIKFNGRDLDLYNATVSGEVSVDGSAPNFFPSICGSNLSGALKLQNIATTGGAFIGDPGEGFPANCAGNLINGSLHVSDSVGLVEIEGNTITGSVILDNSTIELAGNTIGGSVQCTNVTFASDGDPAPNTVGGAIHCP